MYFCIHLYEYKYIYRHEYICLYTCIYAYECCRNVNSSVFHFMQPHFMHMRWTGYCHFFTPSILACEVQIVNTARR